ncbi:Bacterial protein YqhG [compost metagenome]
MNKRQIQTFVMRFLEAYNCSIIEKTPAYVTVKLSPEADKDMTGRPYYWSFVERTGAPAETMTYTLVLDPEQMKPEPKPKQQPVVQSAPVGDGSAGNADTILGRYFGFVPTAVVTRVPKDEVSYGSRRLQQLFSIVGSKGRFVRLFEEPFPMRMPGNANPSYSSWLCINYKLELACDMKRSELHSVAISLNNGDIREHFHKTILTKTMSPKLPANIQMLPDSIPLPRAVHALEMFIEHKIGGYNHSWADDANERHHDEIVRIDSYYNGLLQAVEPEHREDVEARYLNRREEIDWQYRPRIQASVINCGLFHLNSGGMPRN